MNNFLKNFKTRDIAIALVIAIFFIADRYFKALAIHYFSSGGSIGLIGKIFSFHFATNNYIAFSLPLGGHLATIIIGLIIISLLYYIIRLIASKNSQINEILLLTIIVLGAISNILDRLQYGYVIDYLSLRYFTVFNLADIMISIGCIILILKKINRN